MLPADAVAYLPNQCSTSRLDRSHTIYERFLRAAAMTGATDTVLMGLGMVSVPTTLRTPAAFIRVSAASARTGCVQRTKIRLAPFFLHALAA